MLHGEQELRHGFLKKIKLAKTKPHKQGTLNCARMLEHHIQHCTRYQDVGTTYPTSYMNICFINNKTNTQISNRINEPSSRVQLFNVDYLSDEFVGT